MSLTRKSLIFDTAQIKSDDLNLPEKISFDTSQIESDDPILPEKKNSIHHEFRLIRLKCVVYIFLVGIPCL